MPKTKSPAPPAPTKHLVPCDNFGVRRGGGGSPPPPPLGSGPDQGRPPCPVAQVTWRRPGSTTTGTEDNRERYAQRLPWWPGLRDAIKAEGPTRSCSPSHRRSPVQCGDAASCGRWPLRSATAHVPVALLASRWHRCGIAAAAGGCQLLTKSQEGGKKALRAERDTVTGHVIPNPFPSSQASQGPFWHHSGKSRGTPLTHNFKCTFPPIFIKKAECTQICSRRSISARRAARVTKISSGSPSAATGTHVSRRAQLIAICRGRLGPEGVHAISRRGAPRVADRECLCVCAPHLFRPACSTGGVVSDAQVMTPGPRLARTTDATG